MTPGAHPQQGSPGASPVLSARQGASAVRHSHTAAATVVTVYFTPTPARYSIVKACFQDQRRPDQGGYRGTEQPGCVTDLHRPTARGARPQRRLDGRQPRRLVLASADDGGTVARPAENAQHGERPADSGAYVTPGCPTGPDDSCHDARLVGALTTPDGRRNLRSEAPQGWTLSVRHSQLVRYP